MLGRRRKRRAMAGSTWRALHYRLGAAPQHCRVRNAVAADAGGTAPGGEETGDVTLNHDADIDDTCFHPDGLYQIGFS